jgi:hypothetical protein
MSHKGKRTVGVDGYKALYGMEEIFGIEYNTINRKNKMIYEDRTKYVMVRFDIFSISFFYMNLKISRIVFCILFFI